MTVANINGVDLYYEVCGTGEPLVLTHGSWGDATSWDAVMPALTGRFTVIAWDRRGHSRSQDADGPGSYREDAADLAGLTQHLGLDHAHYYGSSSGAIVVLKMLVDRPDLTASVAVHEPPVFGLLGATGDQAIAQSLAETNGRLENVRQMILAGDARGAAEHFIDQVAVGPGAWARFPEGVKAAFVANAHTFATEGADPSDFMVDAEALASSETPVLITLGTQSPAPILAATRELKRRLPRARVATLEQSGHVPYRTHPDLWSKTLGEFYDSLGVATRSAESKGRRLVG